MEEELQAETMADDGSELAAGGCAHSGGRRFRDGSTRQSTGDAHTPTPPPNPPPTSPCLPHLADHAAKVRLQRELQYDARLEAVRPSCCAFPGLLSAAP